VVSLSVSLYINPRSNNLPKKNKLKHDSYDLIQLRNMIMRRKS
jgi:hypothetical protein